MLFCQKQLLARIRSKDDFVKRFLKSEQICINFIFYGNIC